MVEEPAGEVAHRLTVFVSNFVGDRFGRGVEQAEAHFEEAFLLTSEGEAEEGVEGGGDAHEDGLAAESPGQLGEEEEDLVVQVVLQVLANNLKDFRSRYKP